MSGVGPPSLHERRAELVLGLPFLAVATAIALLGDSGRPFALAPAALLVVAYGVLARVRFSAGVGHTAPTQLVLVTMLYTVPTELAPSLVLLGMLVGTMPAYLRRREHPSRALMLPADAWHAVGPTVVLLASGAVDPTGTGWLWLAPALAAQFAVDLGVSLVRSHLALDIPARDQLRTLGWVWLVDTLLTPLGVLAALASIERPYAFLLVLPLGLLLMVFARERNERLEQALELGTAYRGIAMLLGDLLEDADEYTGGDHTRGVVALSLAVADELRLDDRARHTVELAALLHDIGKIAIPSEIINRPGPLDEREWELMRTHTIVGQRMLDRVGGPLTDVGKIVRASHERWDGRGYPDGLAGAAIPREATIVAACDAFNAMTTDRSYRRARSVQEALAELRAQAGAQFAPDVVEALVRVVRSGRAVGAVQSRATVRPSAPAPPSTPSSSASHAASAQRSAAT